MAVLPAVAAAQTRFGYGLPETGSEKLAHTIFTNPGSDCSSSMNISWASPVGTKCMIELTNRYDESVAMIPTYQPELCLTFDSIYSRLCDGENVYESHIFDKYGVELAGLEPDTHYSYRIISRNEATGRSEHSDSYHFRTAGAPSWKAAVIGDFHHYSPSWHRLEAAMDMISTLEDISGGGIDWVLSPGDLNAWGGSFNFWTELSEQPAFKRYMWAVAQGNHDHSDRDRDKSDDFFRNSHFFPYNGYEGQEGVTYWFLYGDVLFFVLNNEAMRTSDELEPVFEWMAEVIDYIPSKYIVVLQHYEWLIGTDGTDSQLDRFRHVFDRLGVDLAVSGNNHAYLRTYPLRDREPVDPADGTYYVVTPSSDNERGRKLKPLRANKDIVAERWSEGPHTVGAMLMDVNPDRIVMTLYDRNGDIHDTFTVPAKR